MDFDFLFAQAGNIFAINMRKVDLQTNILSKDNLLSSEKREALNDIILNCFADYRKLRKYRDRIKKLGNQHDFLLAQPHFKSESYENLIQFHGVMFRGIDDEIIEMIPVEIKTELEKIMKDSYEQLLQESK
jgi:hypothetical protein